MSEEQNPIQWSAIGHRMSQHFTPGSPIDSTGLFCGRTKQIGMIIDSINFRGQHAILYGERGVGKTSLANQLFENISTSKPAVTPHVDCDRSDTFSTVWRKIFSEIQFVNETRKIGFSGETEKQVNTLAESVTSEITPNVVRKLLTMIGGESTVVTIIDEFDKIEDSMTRGLFADTIKILSDRAVPATVLLIGVADDVNSLIFEHQSIERCLQQVHMPRMSKGEIEEIVIKGLEKENMSISPDAMNCITGLSKGLPHYTHLMGLHASREAISQKSLNVTVANTKNAIDVAIEQSRETTRQSYQKATYSAKKEALYKQVLLACAMAQADEFGTFAPVDVRGPLREVLKKPNYSIESFARHLHAFCEESRGPILKKVGWERRVRYRFYNPLMQPFVLLHGVKNKLITDDDIQALADKLPGMLF